MEGFYVTMAKGQPRPGRVALLLGPYLTHARALAEEGRARAYILNEMNMPGAAFLLYGTTRLEVKPGQELPLGKLNDKLGFIPDEAFTLQ